MAVAALSATGAVGSVLATAPLAIVVEMIGWRNAFLALSVFVGVRVIRVMSRLAAAPNP